MDSLFTTATSRDERDRAARVAVLPVGSFEQHGDHLPMVTDTVVACSIARRIAAEYNLFLLPPVAVSCSHEHVGFAGTVSVSARTLIALVEDITDSLRTSGIDRLAIVNGHGGNYVLSNIVQEANVREPRMTLFPNRQDWETARAAAGLRSSHSDDMHAGEAEVSILLHVSPNLVRDGYEHADWLAYPRPHLLVTGMRGYTKSGVIGQPSLGTPEKGQAILDSLTRSFKNHLEVLS